MQVRTTNRCAIVCDVPSQVELRIADTVPDMSIEDMEERIRGMGVLLHPPGQPLLEMSACTADK